MAKRKSYYRKKQDFDPDETVAFEDRKKGSKGNSKKGWDVDKRFASKGADKRRSSDKRRSPDRGRSSRDRKEVEMTKVTCSDCGSECEVPFKPKSDKPLFCDKCFGKHDVKKGGPDLREVNEKLDKIMKALKID